MIQLHVTVGVHAQIPTFQAVQVTRVRGIQARVQALAALVLTAVQADDARKVAVQCQQIAASGAGMQPIHILRNHAANSTQLLQLGERIVGAVRLGAAHAAPTHVGARPVTLTGGVIVAEFLVGHGTVIV